MALWPIQLQIGAAFGWYETRTNTRRQTLLGLKSVSQRVAVHQSAALGTNTSWCYLVGFELVLQRPRLVLGVGGVCPPGEPSGLRTGPLYIIMRK